MSGPGGTGRARGIYKLHFTSGYVNDLAYVWDEVNGAWVKLENACVPLGARGFAAGCVQLPAGWTAGDLGAQGGIFPTDTFVAWKLDETNDYVDSTAGKSAVIDGVAASGLYPLPIYWFSLPYFKLHSLADYSVPSNQTQTDKDVIVFLLG